MNRFTRIFVALVLPFLVGCLLLIPVINSDNGYVAGFVFLPLFLLVALLSLGLFIASLIVIGVKGRPGFWWLPSGFLVFAGFFSLAIIAKQFGLGAYREEPMIAWPSETANIVLLKKGTTNDQINAFFEETLGTKRKDGRGYELLPGVRGTGRLSTYEGHEVLDFEFFESATEERREYVYSRVRSSPIVHELRINVPTEPYRIDSDPPAAPNSNANLKIAVNAPLSD